MDQLVMNEKNGENYILLKLTGVINSYTCQEFKEKVYEEVVKTNVVLDMSEVEGMDSTGMGILMASHNDGEDTSHRLYLMNPSQDAREVIEETGFYDTFHVIRSVTEVR